MMRRLYSQNSRYMRQEILTEIGEKGQAQLAVSSVLVIGVGGLGSASSYYLAAAGIGMLGLVDADQVELSNLNRQILHHTGDIGKLKVDSAAEKIRSFNPEIQIKTYAVQVNAENIKGLMAEYDFVLDATDNFTTKYLISDTCVQLKKAFSHAGVQGFRGQTFTYVPEAAACYRCLFAKQPAEDVLPDKANGGILGTIAGTLGTVQAMEAIKYLIGVGELLTNRLWVFDGKRMQTRLISFQKRKNCPACFP